MSTFICSDRLSSAELLADQIAGADAAEIDAGKEESARTELY